MTSTRDEAFDKGEFLEWAHGELLDNRNRGIVAEFIIAKALGLAGTRRVEWDDVDLVYEGRSIEIKSAANLQSWEQTAPVNCKFNIPKKAAYWDEKLGRRMPLDPPCRMADLYVLCHFKETDRLNADPLCPEQWDFYVLTSATIEENFGDQKQVALTRVQDCCEALGYNALRDKIEAFKTCDHQDRS